MPSEPTTRPRFLKGALVVHESQTPGPPPKVIVFQYNPEQVKRSLEKRAVESKGGGSSPSKEDLLRAAGPPAETINLQITLDAADQLAEPDSNQTTVENGLFPMLSVLEMLLYPPTTRVQQIDAAAGQGEVQVSPADLPLVLLVWGQSRVVPVMLTSFTVSEESFDVNLNPIRAKIDLAMKVLTYLELKKNTIGYDAYLSYQRRKEQHAAKYRAGAGESAVLQTVDQSRR
ncbi:MAG: hypothetical protein IT159_02285 [Bryobacterales bacterium]|nr:hypothetical protein [Bryobacterales bacterium]